MRVLQPKMTNSDKLNFNYAGFRLKTYIELEQQHIESLARNMERQQR